MYIIGAGLSGLLCAVLNPNSTIFEASSQRPYSHKSLLRLRSPEIGKLTGIPFTEVTVHKGIWSAGKAATPSIQLAHLYSQKVSHTITPRSIFNLKSERRFIPPDNFIDQLTDKVRSIEYGVKISAITHNAIFEAGENNGTPRNGMPIVSTIPLPSLAKVLAVAMNRETPEVGARTITVNRYKIQACDSYVTMYYPDPFTGVYRATLNGDTLIIESVSDIHTNDIGMVSNSLGIPPEYFEDELIDYRQSYGKINPIDNQWRQQFILRATMDYGVYSLGRFATWRPKVLLDDVLEDIFHIRRMINQGNYAAQKHQQED